MRKLLVTEGEISRPEFDLVEGVVKKVLLKTKKM